MTFDEMAKALDEAKQVQALADLQADRLARHLIGRLRKVDSRLTLWKLKKELQSYNMQTGQWKEGA